MFYFDSIFLSFVEMEGLILTYGLSLLYIDTVIIIDITLDTELIVDLKSFVG